MRSRKHSVSFTFHELCNVKWIRFLSEFGNNFQSEREYRKVVIATIDGGPDENPCYTNTFNCATRYFLEQDFDAPLVDTNPFG